MITAEGYELIAEMILAKHHEENHPLDCFCWQLRQIPEILEAIAKLKCAQPKSDAQP